MDYSKRTVDFLRTFNMSTAVLDSSFHAFIRLKGLQEIRVLAICQNEPVGMTVE